jgi:hypothetical protein
LLTGHVAIGNNSAVDQILPPYVSVITLAPSALRTQDNVSGDLSVNEWMDSISDYSNYSHIGTASAGIYGYDAEPIIAGTSTGPFGAFYGNYFGPTNEGSGNIGDFEAGYFAPYNEGSGNITNLAGLSVFRGGRPIGLLDEWPSSDQGERNPKTIGPFGPQRAVVVERRRCALPARHESPKLR